MAHVHELFQKHIVKSGSFDSKEEGAHVYFAKYYPKKKLNKKIIHVIFQHGLIEHQGVHHEFIDYLRETYDDRVVISCMDLVGHGHSGGPRVWVDSFDTYLDDFFRFLKVVNDWDEKQEVANFIVAHSLGGMLVLKAILDKKRSFDFKLCGSVLINPCIKVKLKFPKILASLMENIAPRVSRVRLPSLYNGFDLTTDHDKAIEFNHDILNSDFITVHLGMEILREGKELIKLAYYMNTSSLFLLSGDDKLVDTKTTRLFVSGMQKNIANIKYYPKKRHDLLNETCRIDVYKEIIKFIEERNVC